MRRDKGMTRISCKNSIHGQIRTGTRALLCFGSLVFGEALYSHHAPFIYDTETERVVSGIVKSFEWIQPHAWVELETKGPDGELSTWLLEGMSPLYLGRRGWNRYSLNVGDAIEVAFLPRRDGSREGMFLRATLPDGSLKVMAVNPNPPSGE